jgi:glycerol-3-phosphate dehydrogenase subunit C
MGAVGIPIAVKDATSLSAELTRIADICHGCRRCFSLCPSFDVLFKGLDVAEVDGEAEKLPKKVLDDFVDLCYE